MKVDFPPQPKNFPKFYFCVTQQLLTPSEITLWVGMLVKKDGHWKGNRVVV